MAATAVAVAVAFLYSAFTHTRRRGCLLQAAFLTLLIATLLGAFLAVLASSESLLALSLFFLLLFAYFGLNWELLLAIREGRSRVSPRAFFAVTRRRAAGSISMLGLLLCLVLPPTAMTYAGLAESELGGALGLALGLGAAASLGRYLAVVVLTRFGGLSEEDARRMVAS